jgi:hypothetical protein
VDGSEKLDARSRYVLSQQSEDAAPVEMSVLVRGEKPFSETELETLRALGAQIRTVAGDVLTATVASDVVERVAEEPFVLSLEVSQPLYPDEPGEPFAADVE